MSVEMCLLSRVVPYGSGEAHSTFQYGHGLPSLSWISKIARTCVKYCSISWRIMYLNKLSESLLRTILNFPYHFPID